MSQSNSFKHEKGQFYDKFQTILLCMNQKSQNLSIDLIFEWKILLMAQLFGQNFFARFQYFLPFSSKISTKNPLKLFQLQILSQSN